MVCTKSRKRKKSVAKHPSEKCQQSSSFLFLSNQNVIRHVLRSKTMFITRGLPGSGKSTLVKKIQAKYKGAVVCSADTYFSKDGEYEYNQDELSHAHQDCKEKVKEACEAAVPVVVVDNTNVRRWEMNSYFGIAHHQNYDVILVEPNTPWKFDPVELAKRNSHGVTEEILQQKLSHFETVFPLYYGWFLNETDSERLFKLGQDVFRRCMNVPVFSKIFRKEAGVDQENLTFDNFFKRKHFKTSIETLHCTTMFSLRGKKPETLDYIAQESVEKAMGQVFMLSVIGFSISPRAFGARLRLNNTQLRLWFRDDNEERPVESPKSTPSPERVKDSANEGEKDTSKKSNRKKKSKKTDLSSKEFGDKRVSTECSKVQQDSSSVSGKDDDKHLAVQPDTGIQFFPAPSKKGVQSWSSIVSGSGLTTIETKPNRDCSSAGISGLENCDTRTPSASKTLNVVVTGGDCSKPDQQPEGQAYKNTVTNLAFESDDDDDAWFGAFDLGGHSSNEELGDQQNSEGLKTADNICNNLTLAIADSKPNSGANVSESSSSDVVSVELPIEHGCGESTGCPFMPLVSDSHTGENMFEPKSCENIKTDTGRPSSCLPSGKAVSKVKLFRTIGQEVDSDETSKHKETVSKIVELADKMVAFLEVCENHNEKGDSGSGLEIHEVTLNSDLKAVSSRVEICPGCDEVFEMVDEGKSGVVGEGETSVSVVGERQRVVVGEKKVEISQTGKRHRKTSRDKVDIGLLRQRRPSLELEEQELESILSPGIESEVATEVKAEFSPVEKTRRMADVVGPGDSENVKERKKVQTNPVVDTLTYVPVATDRKEDEIVVKKTLIFEKKLTIAQIKSSETDVATKPKVETLIKTESEGSPNKKKKKKKKKKKGEELLGGTISMAGEVGCGENGELDQQVEGKVESSPEPSAGLVKNEDDGAAKKKKPGMESSESSALNLKPEREKFEKGGENKYADEPGSGKPVDLASEGKEHVVKKKKKASVATEPVPPEEKPLGAKGPGGKKMNRIKKAGSVFDDEISAILFEIENAGSGLEKKGQRKQKGGGGVISKLSNKDTQSRKSKGDQEIGAKKKTRIEKSPVLNIGIDDAQIQSNVCKPDSETCSPKEVEKIGIEERCVSDKESRGKSGTNIVDMEKTLILDAQEAGLSIPTNEASRPSCQNLEDVSDDGWHVVTKGGSRKSIPVFETSPYLPNASVGPPKPKLKFDNQTSGVEQAEGASAVGFDLDSPEIDQSQKFRPTSGFGSRAHITIGCAENLSPVEAGYDLVEMIKFEAKDGSDKSTFLIDGASVKHYGGGHFGVYFDKVVRFEALFGGYY